MTPGDEKSQRLVHKLEFIDLIGLFCMVLGLSVSPKGYCF